MTERSLLTREILRDFMSRHRLAVIATASGDGQPEAALINIAVTPELDIIFETTSATRKFPNLEMNPRVSLVIGWQGDKTLQLDGMVEELESTAYEKLTPTFFSAFPEKSSHEYWPGNLYFRVRPYWFRLSAYGVSPKVEELQIANAPKRRIPRHYRLYQWFRTVWRGGS